MTILAGVSLVVSCLLYRQLLVQDLNNYVYLRPSYLLSYFDVKFTQLREYTLKSDGLN